MFDPAERNCSEKEFLFQEAVETMYGKVILRLKGSAFVRRFCTVQFGSPFLFEMKFDIQFVANAAWKALTLNATL